MLIQMADRVATSVDLPPLPEAEREEREEREVPPEAVVLLSRAEVAMDRGRTDRAIELYQQVTQEFPDYTEAQEALDQILTG